MSRSRKKVPIIKDNGSWGYYRKLSHHCIRANVRNTLNSRIDYESMMFPKNKGQEFVNQYSVCDYKFGPYYWYTRRYKSDFIKKSDALKHYRK